MFYYDKLIDESETLDYYTPQELPKPVTFLYNFQFQARIQQLLSFLDI